jgi:hypothetical protein
MRKRKSPMYRVWLAMTERCRNPNNRKFAIYGGRGIRVCERWLVFKNFLADMGERPSSMHTLERRDNNGNYEPGNVRWATYKEQARNTRTNRLLTFNGKTQCAAAWEEEMGLRRGAIRQRLDQDGWSVEKAITTPKCGTVKPDPEVLRAKRAASRRKHQNTDAYREKHRLYMREWNRRKSLNE